MNDADAAQLSKFRKVLNYLICITFIALIVWFCYINRPRTPFEVSNHDFNVSAVNVDAASESGEKATDLETENDETEATESLPFTLNLVYSPGYLIDIGGLEKLHPFDIGKYEKIHESLKTDGLVTDEQTWKPEPLKEEDLLLIHSGEYLKSLQDRTQLVQYLEAGALMFAPVNLDRAVLRPFRRASGGTLLAARTALKSGIGVNIGGGYHHAKPELGEGFCVYADVPIAIRKLQQEKQIETALVIDVDVHQGNGTILCLDDDDSTFTFSMHQGNIYPIPKEVGDLDVNLRSGMGDDEYLEVLQENLPALLESKPDICFIVGGCDPLDGDPLASLRMSPDGIVKRDHQIIDACVKQNIPVVLTLSGGYSPNAWESQYKSIKNLIETYGLNPAPHDDSEADTTDKNRKK